MSENKERRAARKRLQARYRALYDKIVDILFEIDPIGVHVDHNAEKFVPEATSILARLREARFAEDVENIVKQELRRWYGRRRLAHQDPQRLARATIAICSGWNQFLDNSASQPHLDSNTKPT
jgi:PAS domain-containing protein